MTKAARKLAKEVEALPATERLRLVDAILTELDRPDPEIDGVWAKESRRRWAAYKSGRARTVSYETVMAKHRRS